MNSRSRWTGPVVYASFLLAMASCTPGNTGGMDGGDRGDVADVQAPGRDEGRDETTVADGQAELPQDVPTVDDGDAAEVVDPGTDEAAEDDTDVVVPPEDEGDVPVQADAPDASDVSVPPTCATTWTVLVYMAADNNLEKQGIKDLEELLEVPSSECIEVVVQIDRILGFYELGFGPLDPWMTTKRIRIDGGALTELADLGETDAGDPASLADFIRWGREQFPADKTALILWNHGNAWQGYGVDDSSDGNNLSLAEVFQALADGTAGAGPEPFAFIAFDACLMADYANLLGMQDFTRYLLVSEEFVPGHGWDYRVFGKLAAAPAMTETAFGQEVLAAFEKQAKVNNTVSFVTMAVLDLHRMPAVESAVDSFLEGLTAALDTSVVQIGEARAQVQEFGSNADPAKSYQMVDLGQLATLVGGRIPSLAPRAEALVQALGDLVVAQVTGKTRENARGVSLYFPAKEALYLPAFKAITSLHAWDAFLHAYYARQAAWDAAPAFLGGVGHGGETAAKGARRLRDDGPACETGCRLPQGHATVTCDTDGGLVVEGTLSPGSAEVTSEVSLHVGFFSASDERLVITGRVEALLHEAASHVIGTWDQRVVTMVHGAAQRPLFSRTTASGKLSFHEVPMLYSEPPACGSGCAPGAGELDSFRQPKGTRYTASWLVTTNRVTGEVLGANMYINSPGGWGEMVPVPGAELWPSRPRGSPFAGWTMEPDDDPIRVDPAHALRFRCSTIRGLAILDADGEIVPGPDGTPLAVGQALGFTHAYLELTALAFNGLGDRTYFVQPLDACEPQAANWCARAGEVPDCKGECHHSAHLHDAVCDDGTAGVDFNCLVYAYDDGDCKTPECPAGRVRDCNLLCLAVAYQVGDGTCHEGGSETVPDLNCEAHAWDGGDCPCGDACSGHGTCVDRACTCEAGWLPPYCAKPSTCGDGTCSAAGDENCRACPEDCGPCPDPCGDGACKPGDGEDCRTCPGDCGVCGCGDGACTTATESCVTCPADCGSCPECGDQVCAKWTAGAPFPASLQENCGTCPNDCGACAGPCCLPSDTPAGKTLAGADGRWPYPGGCDDAAVSACVCALVPSCCERRWTTTCAGLARDLCGLECPCGWLPLGSDPAICDDADACTVDSCDPASGACSHRPVACDDDNPCTDDGCDPATGCIHANNLGPCDDGDACTTESCAGGRCVPRAVSCDDDNPCTDDWCDPVTGCTSTDNSRPCDDGSACTRADTCGAGTCAGVAVSCDDGNPCTDDWCDPATGCVQANNQGPCDDGDACTGAGTCKAGACIVLAIDCDDGNPCTDDSCAPATGCAYEYNLNACDDGDACSLQDGCILGVCAGIPDPCDDGNPCTDDSCDPATGCTHANNQGPCDDGDPCTRDDTCQVLTATCQGSPRCVATACQASSTCDGDGNCIVTPQPVGAACTSDQDGCTTDTCQPTALTGFVVSTDALWDVASTGNPTGLTGRDATAGPFPIGFEFDYFGDTVTQFWVGTSGVISFRDQQVGPVNASIPDGITLDGFIAPFWDDLEVGPAGSVTYYSYDPGDGGTLLVQWSNVRRVGRPDEFLNFQVALSERGRSVSFRYGALSGVTGDTATVGMVPLGAGQNGKPLGFQFSHDRAALRDDFALVAGAPACAHESKADGEPCSPVSFCATCEAGACVSPCDDGNPLTEDVCAQPCIHTSVVRRIPAGTFRMGCDGAIDSDCEGVESPQHPVWLDQFAIDLTEVTVTSYRECVDAYTCSEPAAGEGCVYDAAGSADLAVNCVTWGQADAYCTWAGKRLCSEAEWEMAARGTCDLYPDGDCASATPRFPWGDALPDCDRAVANLPGCGGGVGPVGALPGGASPYGVLDLAGNVAEWMGNVWHASYALYPTGGDLLETGEFRAVRGGSFDSSASGLRASRRSFQHHVFASPQIGFRCCYTYIGDPID